MMKMGVLNTRSSVFQVVESPSKGIFEQANSCSLIGFRCVSWTQREKALSSYEFPTCCPLLLSDDSSWSFLHSKRNVCSSEKQKELIVFPDMTAWKSLR